MISPRAVKLLLVTVALGSAMTLLGAKKASATHIGFPWWSMPGYLAPTFPSCGHTGQSPCLWSWLSAPGAPTSSTVDVPYGAPSVQLDLNDAGVISIPNTNGAFDVRNGILNAWANQPGTISGLTGAVLQLYWPPNSHRVPGNWSQTARRFTYAPNGGFTTSGYYQIVVDGRTINHFASGTYGCAAPGGGTTPGWNYDWCPYEPQVYNIYINVAPPPPDTGSCSFSGVPTMAYPGQTFTANFTVRNTGTYWAWSVNNTNPARYRLREVGSWPGAPVEEIRGGQVVDTGFYGQILYPGRTATWSAGFTAPGLGTYNLTWEVYGYNAASGYHVVTSCTRTITVAERPYFRSYGGDVQAGAGFGTSCAKGLARIIGLNNGTNPYTGAGSQLAAFAISQIIDFATGTNRAPPQPNHLSFARSGGGANYNATYGGGLAAGHMSCIPDYFAAYPGGGTDPGATLNVNPASGKTTYYRNGNLTLTQAALQGVDEGESLTIYVNGNVYIQDSITYRDTSSYADAKEIPSFRLIVRGNIFVAPGVSRLDGLYIAQPNTNVLAEESGRFYTCGFAFRAPTNAELIGACRTRLTVHGAVIANILKLTRTTGSVNNSQPNEYFNFATNTPTNGNPAEVFIYSPEMWLLEGGLSNDDGYDAIVPLPPVL